MLSNHPSKLILENNFILLIIKGIMRDHVSTVSRAQRPETESSTQEELSSSNITCFIITPLITILRWFSLFFAKLLCNFSFVRGALLQLTATRVGSWETKSCKALTRICFDNTASFGIYASHVSFDSPHFLFVFEFEALTLSVQGSSHTGGEKLQGRKN